MRNLLTIVLCTALVFTTFNTFGQIKQGKNVKQNANVQQNATASSTQFNINTNTKPACWKITGRNGDTEYRWDTEANVKQWINEMRTQHNEIYEYTATTYKDEYTCDAHNEKYNDKKCWKITATKNGQTLEQYLWSTETVARRKVASLQSDGYQQAKYIETPANDEKSCNATSNTSSNEPACWKITIDGNVTYQWGYEQDARSTVNAARNSGQTASYELSPNKTKDSCQ